MTHGPRQIMHFPQVERTSCSGFPYTKANFQEKTRFHREARDANVSTYPEF
jgi:hypothetical protein